MSRAQNLFGTTRNYDRSGEATSKTMDGFPAFERSLHEQYLQTLMTNTMGNTFYASQHDLMKESMALHQKMLTTDPEFMAKAVIYARNEGYMRLQPIVGLVHLSKAQNKFYFRAAFDSVIRTPGDLEDFVTICGNVRQGRGLGRSVKTAIANWLNGMSQYHAIKYGASRGQGGWDLGNIIKATHPRPKDETQGQLFNYVANREANLGQLQQINELERLKNLQNMRKEMTDKQFYAEVVDSIERGKLPWEIVTGIIQPTKEIWVYLMKQMPYFALLRNINTLLRAGVLEDKENVKYVVTRLTDPEAISRAMILPFRFDTALQHTSGAPAISDAIRKAMELSFQNVPVIRGNNYYFLDTSGSMEGEFLRIGGTLGMAAFAKSEDPNFMCFETLLHYPNISKMDSMATNLDRVMKVKRGGTNTGLCIEHLLGTARSARVNLWGSHPSEGGYGDVPASMRSKAPIKCDNIVIITDEQQNAGSMVLSKFTEYRAKVNKDAKLFIIDVAPYNGRSLAPDKEPNVYFIYGWSDDVLKYLAFVTEGIGTQVDAVNKIELRVG